MTDLETLKAKVKKNWEETEKQYNAANAKFIKAPVSSGSLDLAMLSGALQVYREVNAMIESMQQMDLFGGGK